MNQSSRNICFMGKYRTNKKYKYLLSVRRRTNCKCRSAPHPWSYHRTQYGAVPARNLAHSTITIHISSNPSQARSGCRPDTKIITAPVRVSPGHKNHHSCAAVAVVPGFEPGHQIPSSLLPSAAFHTTIIMALLLLQLCSLRHHHHHHGSVRVSSGCPPETKLTTAPVRVSPGHKYHHSSGPAIIRPPNTSLRRCRCPPASKYIAAALLFLFCSASSRAPNSVITAAIAFHKYSPLLIGRGDVVRHPGGCA